MFPLLLLRALPWEGRGGRNELAPHEPGSILSDTASRDFVKRMREVVGWNWDASEHYSVTLDWRWGGRRESASENESYFRGSSCCFRIVHLFM